jgi:hypothetical protein
LKHLMFEHDVVQADALLHAHTCSDCTDWMVAEH